MQAPIYQSYVQVLKALKKTRPASSSAFRFRARFVEYSWFTAPIMVKIIDMERLVNCGPDGPAGRKIHQVPFFVNNIVLDQHHAARCTHDRDRERHREWYQGIRGGM